MRFQPPTVYLLTNECNTDDLFMIRVMRRVGNKLTIKFMQIDRAKDQDVAYLADRPGT